MGEGKQNNLPPGSRLAMSTRDEYQGTREKEEDRVRKYLAGNRRGIRRQLYQNLTKTEPEHSIYEIRTSLFLNRYQRPW